MSHLHVSEIKRKISCLTFCVQYKGRNYQCKRTTLRCIVQYLLHSCTAALRHICAVALLYSCTPAQLHCCTVALMHSCTAAQLHCFTVALFTTVLTHTTIMSHCFPNICLVLYLHCTILLSN